METFGLQHSICILLYMYPVLLYCSKLVQLNYLYICLLYIRVFDFSSVFSPGNPCPGSLGLPRHIKFRLAVVPLAEQLIHLLLSRYSMKFLLFCILPLLETVAGDERGRKVYWHVFPHFFEELHHAFVSKLPRVKDTGFIEELLLHVQIVAPVTGLHRACIVVQKGLKDTGQCSQYDEEEKNGPANCLLRTNTRQ